MSTPKVSGSNKIKSKYSPFGSAISKSLLTPCRQVGLSRKRKTPLSNPIKSSENLNSDNCTSISSRNSSNSDTTPVNHSKFLKKRKKNENELLNFKSSSGGSCEVNTILKENENMQESCDIKSSKKDLLQTFTSEDLFNMSDDQPCSLEKNEIIETTENAIPHMKGNISQISNREYSKIEKGDVQQNVSDKKMAKKNLSSDFKTFESVSKKSGRSFSQTSVSDNSDDDFMITGNSGNTQRSVKERETKPLKKTISSKKSLLSVADDKNDSREMNCIQKCKIHLQKLDEDEVNSSNFVDHITSIKTLNIKCNSNVVDDAEFFTSTPEEEIVKRKDLEKKMRSLESEIKQKQSILENLERASVYRSKHDIPELKRLTSLWLDGCVQALKDLLVHLQGHGPIDLITILNNMQIPKEIIAKLPL